MRIRAFLAANFSIAVTRRIAEEVAAHREPVAQAGLRVAWVPPANLHLTLKFLGSVREESLEAVAGALLRLPPRAPIDLRAHGLGAFPSVEAPRVLWVGVSANDGSDTLAQLAREVESAMTELGFAKEERPFHPHVTVGRVKERGPGWEAVRWTSQVDLGASTVSELVLYESKTLHDGAEYVARARIPFGR
jgi:2'-5' RNA ligase